MKTPRALLGTLALAMVALVPSPASADHPPTSKWANGATVNWQNRTGVPEFTALLQVGADAWNSAGANLSVVVTAGPSDNCFFFEYPLVKWCQGSLGEQSANTSTYPGGGTIDRATVVVDPSALNAIWPGTHEGGHTLGMPHSCDVSTMNRGGSPPGPNGCAGDYSGYRLFPTDHDRAVLLATYGARTEPSVVVQGSTWFNNGTKALTAQTLTSVVARATGVVVGVPYQLVAGTGTAQQPCRHNRMLLNRTKVYAGSSGIIGNVTGKAYLNPGEWQVCFAQADPVSGSRAVTSVATLTVTA